METAETTTTETVTSTAEEGATSTEAQATPAEQDAQKTAEEASKTTAEEAEKAAKRDRVQERFDVLTREKWEARREADYQRQRAEALERQTQGGSAPAGKDESPKAEDFETHEQFVKAVARHEARQELAESRRKEEQQSTARQAEEGLRTARQRILDEGSKITDFMQSVVENGPPFTPEMVVAIGECERPAEVAYYLATHPEDFRKLAAQKSERSMGREVGRLDAMFSLKPPIREAQPVKATTSALGAARESSGTPEEKMTHADWFANEDKKFQEKLKARFRR